MLVRAVLFCVFFTQHPVEKRFLTLWEGRFFVAPRVLLANVLSATEGGIPVSRYPVGRIAPSGKPGLEIEVGSIAWCEKFLRVAGSKGKFHRCLSH